MNIYQFFTGFLLFLLPIISYSQDYSYELRFQVHEFDCNNGVLLVDIEVKSSTEGNDFLIGNQNYRFTYNQMALTNPSIKNELTLSSVLVGNGYTAFFNPHNLMGTMGNTVSYNVQLGNGTGYPISQEWVAVGRLQFEVVNLDAPFNLSWNTEGMSPSTAIASSSGSLHQGELKGYLTFEKRFELKLFLEGAYDVNTGKMTTFLNLAADDPLSRGVLPGQTPFASTTIATPAGQPFNQAPWDYNGTEGMDIIAYAPTVVDWVYVSILQGNPGAQVVAWRAAALLHSNGDVEFFDLPDFEQLPDEFYIKVDHRNHMAIMTPSKLLNTECNAILVDFTKVNSYTSGAQFGQKPLEPGVFAMFGGDSDKVSDFPFYSISGSDKIQWSIENGIFDAYRSNDFNLDGEVNSLDKLLWVENNGISSGVSQ